MSEGTTMRYTGQLTVISCVSCGIEFAVPDSWRARRLDDHKDWYCPNGHGQSYTGKSEAEQLRARLERAEAREQSWRDQAQAAERSRIAVAGHLTRVKRRVANGVCPCCQRQFANLHRHMTTQHPTYADQEHQP
jgi:Zn ribbon nucleic-acid-binding protein